MGKNEILKSYNLRQLIHADIGNKMKNNLQFLKDNMIPKQGAILLKPNMSYLIQHEELQDLNNTRLAMWQKKIYKHTNVQQMIMIMTCTVLEQQSDWTCLFVLDKRKQ